MITFPLTLKPAPGAAHAAAAAAWFIPGDDPAGWLAEVTRWGVPTAALRLYVLPTSPRDRTPVGVLVLPQAADVTPKGAGRAQPYALLAGRLYVPADAALSPPVSDAELRAGLRLDVQVLHPAAGLVGFTASEALAVHDLLEPPARRDARWDLAVPGAAGTPRLVSVEPEEVPGRVEDVLREGRGDIGSGAPDALPPAADESKLADWAKRAAVPPLKALGALPGVGGIGQWARDKLERVSKSLEQARFREIERLRKMLETNPDEGLRHAIPLRDVGTRGRAAPGARLSPRDVNFSLSNLFGGGGGADAWHVPSDVLEQLRRRYREAANRELRLGRYRRAAYILAELLGDFAAAASALEQGRHYREAAVLYRDQLKNPRQAAECLERGGLLPEAIVLYEQLGMHEKAGDLHATLEQTEAAARSYRTQVDADLSRRDVMAAARLLETKLRAPDEALEVLSGAWPAHDAAGECLRESFALLARMSRHDEALARLGKFRALHPPPGRGEQLAQVLGHVAATYPEANVRTLGADATRVVAGVVLPEAGMADRQAVARAVGRLAPEDRLLARDVERFLARPVVRPSRPPAPRTLRAAGDPVVLRQFRLPDGVDWITAAEHRQGFVALGVVQGGVVILRGDWQGRSQVAHWNVFSYRAWRLHPVPGEPQVTVLPVPNPPRPIVLPKTDAFAAPLEIGAPAWLAQPDLLAVAHAENGVTWVLHEPTRGAVTLGRHHSAGGDLLASHALTGVAQVDAPVFMAAGSGEMLAAWGSIALTMDVAGGLQWFPVASAVRCVAASAGGGRERFAAGLEHGGLLVRPGGHNSPFGEGLHEPSLTFTRGGLLVAATDSGEGRVYRTDGDEPRRDGGFETPRRKLLALMRTPPLNGFATLTAGGEVTVYQVPV